MGNPSGFEGEAKLLLLPLEMLLHAPGGEVAKFMEGKEVSFALPYPHPFSSLPLIPPWAWEGSTGVHTDFLEDVVELRQSLLL